MSRSFAAMITVALMFSGMVIEAAPPLAAPSTAKVWPYSEMKWQNDKTLSTVRSAPLWGNPAHGEHGMLRKFPAGYAPPAHKHPSVERVVVISGTIVVQYTGSGETTLGPGSYSEIPAGTAHAVRCGRESECLFLLTSSGPFAIIPTSPPHQ